MLESYEIAWRPNYEKNQLFVWLVFAGFSFLLPTVTWVPAKPAMVFSFVCVFMAVLRGFPANRNARRLKHLQAVMLQFVSRKSVISKTKKKKKQEMLWLGYGFEWETKHAQLAADLMKRDPSKFGGTNPKHPGAAWLHGLSEKEQEIDVPLSMLDGMTMIVGTTGAGKTRLLDLMITQAIARGESVFVLDPKGDVDLWKGMLRTCEEIGRPEKFLYFHPGFPEKSIRIDPLASFTRATELASRIAMLIPSETGSSDPFKAFCQMALTKVIAGIMEDGSKPSLRQIRHYLEGGIDKLLLRVLIKHCKNADPDYADKAKTYMARRRGNELDGFIEFYNAEIRDTKPSQEVEGLIDMYRHDRVHFGKMITSLMPVLTSLTTGDIGDLLSPTKGDADPRLVTDSASIIRGGKVAYIGLDSLTDGIIASAVGSILLSDLTSVAGSRYNYSDGNYKHVNLYVDELAELVNDPLISLLARGRGANIRVTTATQTVADLSAKLGSEDKARQVISNCNNTIALRTPEPKTQQYLTEALPKTSIKHIMQTQGTNTDSEVPLVYGTNFGERLMETEKEIFSPEYLGLLPNFHFLARLTGGRLMKGRLPFIQDEGEADLSHIPPDRRWVETETITNEQSEMKEAANGVRDAETAPSWRQVNTREHEKEERLGLYHRDD